MAKFLNKKEQVIDFQLTPYGNYLLATGIFKPSYYAFYDSNILYDKQYVRGTYCKSASCGTNEITKVQFVSDTREHYTSMGTEPPPLGTGIEAPINYLTIYNGSTPFHFWFYTNEADRPPGSGIIGVKPKIDIKDTSAESKEQFAWKFYKDVSSGPWPFTATHTAGSDIVYITANESGPMTDVSQTISANYVTGSVHVQGAPNEVFRADSDVPVENQNEIEKRIKRETQYLEGILCFTDLEDEPRKRRQHAPHHGSTPFVYDVTAIRENPQKDIFKFDSAIGDVMFDNENKQTTPAWKIVTLAGQISSSTAKDNRHEQLIPQVNIDVLYSKEVKDIKFEFEDNTVQETIDTVIETERTKAFVDGKTIALESSDLVIYAEELNSEFLSENFDIEVYEVLPAKFDAKGVELMHTERLRRKFFDESLPQIVDGMMVRSTPHTTDSPITYSTSSVEYYFDIYTDLRVNKKLACQGANIFNKDSYYIDIDFECEQEKADDLYYDIYGSATDPEICQT